MGQNRLQKYRVSINVTILPDCADWRTAPIGVDGRRRERESETTLSPSDRVYGSGWRSKKREIEFSNFWKMMMQCCAIALFHPLRAELHIHRGIEQQTTVSPLADNILHHSLMSKSLHNSGYSCFCFIFQFYKEHTVAGPPPSTSDLWMMQSPPKTLLL
jgi:hypothetical protein